MVGPHSGGVCSYPITECGEDVVIFHTGIHICILLCILALDSTYAMVKYAVEIESRNGKTDDLTTGGPAHLYYKYCNTPISQF